MKRVWKAFSCACALVAACGDGAATTVAVSNNVQLSAALAKAVGGETIELAPGQYAMLELAAKSYNKPVVVTAKAESSTVLIRRVALDGVSNLTLRSLEIGGPLAPGEPDFTRLTSVTGSSNIRLENVYLHGSLDGNPNNDAWGAYVTASNNVSVTGSRFEQLIRGLVVSNSTDITVAENIFRDLGSDGSDFAAVDRLLVRANCYTNFTPAPGDHPDAIQFWTAGVPKASSQVRIVDNVILQGEGGGLQGIFMGSETGARYRDIKVVNNLIYVQDQYHGINVSNADTVLISGNTVISLPDDKPVWITFGEVSDITIEGNVTDMILNREKIAATIRNNLELGASDKIRKSFPNLVAGARALPRDITLVGRGYQPPEAGAAPQCTRN